MRRYLRRSWTPVLLTAELPDLDCPLVRVWVLGEQSVAFGATRDRIGRLRELCPHRPASLYFGRNAACGLRGVYHDWTFDVKGRCVDLPNEPAESRIKEKIRTRAYPGREWSGPIWASADLPP